VIAVRAGALKNNLQFWEIPTIIQNVFLSFPFRVMAEVS
jgi:hypothetical protein